ncbi:MAG: hypothetical protein FWH37_07650 [Candidatus Bathyarchaeota archaeon]|nr:hypothetical protein [Candidatus Termiticorpusculum sp.]
MKPYPIPSLSEQAAEEFERAIKNGPTEQQKKVMREALAMFAKLVKIGITDK